MTDSAMKKLGKRERLIESARELIHEQGVHETSLADIADRADVPLGNVYYYFKTKNDLVEAVVEDHAGQIQALLARLDARQTPKARLKGLARNWADAAPMVARSGCPLGSLCSELAKGGGRPDASSDFFEILSTWIESQFRELGRKDAPDLALMLLSGVQGGALLSNTFHDEQIMRRQVRQLDRWIDSIA